MVPSIASSRGLCVTWCAWSSSAGQVLWRSPAISKVVKRTSCTMSPTQGRSGSEIFCEPQNKTADFVIFLLFLFWWLGHEETKMQEYKTENKVTEILTLKTRCIFVVFIWQLSIINIIHQQWLCNIFLSILSLLIIIKGPSRTLFWGFQEFWNCENSFKMKYLYIRLVLKYRRIKWNTFWIRCLRNKFLFSDLKSTISCEQLAHWSSG